MPIQVIQYELSIVAIVPFLLPRGELSFDSLCTKGVGRLYWQPLDIDGDYGMSSMEDRIQCSVVLIHQKGSFSFPERRRLVVSLT